MCVHFKVYDVCSGKQQLLAPMKYSRSGAGSGFGPDGAFYIIGGSEDGAHALHFCERYDPREVSLVCVVTVCMAGEWESQSVSQSASYASFPKLRVVPVFRLYGLATLFLYKYIPQCALLDARE